MCPQDIFHVKLFSHTACHCVGTYIHEDLGALFIEAGLTPGHKTVASSTKALSFTKPLQAPETALAAAPVPSGAANNGTNGAPAGRPLMVGRPAGQPSAGLVTGTS